MTRDDHLWRCKDCGTHHPIQPLARDCEARHAREQEEETRAAS